MLCDECRGTELTSEVWRLDLGGMRWKRAGHLTTPRASPACCVVRDSIVVVGGFDKDEACIASVDILRYDSETGEYVSKDLPPLTCGAVEAAVVLPIVDTTSVEGQVLLIGGVDEEEVVSKVYIVDLATGACSPHLGDGRMFAREATSVTKLRKSMAFGTGERLRT